MNTFQIATVISLSLWVGGLALFATVVTPAIFRSLDRKEAGRIVGILFPVVDRWISVWAAVAVVAVAGMFLGRHFERASLLLEVPVVTMAWLTWHSAFILHPQIRDLKRRLNLPEFQETAHLETIRHSFNRMHRHSVRLGSLVLFLGLFSLGILPTLLR